jgi:YhcH/YjgK/YiaL family protein
MIFDSLKNINYYFSDEVCNLITQCYHHPDDFTFENSRDIFVKKIEYLTKSENECKIESHFIYTDFQCLIDGEELIKIYNPLELEKASEYDETQDVIFYKDSIVNLNNITLTKGYFCLFFPQDAHKAGIQLKNKCLVNKIVIKINTKILK